VSWRRHRLRFKSVCQLVFFKAAMSTMWVTMTTNERQWVQYL
jgi:hypothetical protein